MMRSTNSANSGSGSACVTARINGTEADNSWRNSSVRTVVSKEAPFSPNSSWVEETEWVGDHLAPHYRDAAGSGFALTPQDDSKGLPRGSPKVRWKQGPCKRPVVCSRDGRLRKYHRKWRGQLAQTLHLISHSKIRASVIILLKARGHRDKLLIIG